MPPLDQNRVKMRKSNVEGNTHPYYFVQEMRKTLEVAKNLISNKLDGRNSVIEICQFLT